MFQYLCDKCGKNIKRGEARNIYAPAGEIPTHYDICLKCFQLLKKWILKKED